MTLICAYVSRNSIPIVVGDILLSNESITTSEFTLPSANLTQKENIHGLNFLISGLSQKIAIIGNNLVLAWAGSRIYAQAILQDIYNLNCENPFTFEALVNYFEVLDDIEWKRKDLSLVGFIISEGKLVSVGWDCNTEGRYGNSPHILSQGTGGPKAVTYLKSFTFNQAEIELLNAGMNPYAIGSFLGLSLTGALLSEDIISYENIRTGYGGFYECVTLNRDGFQKVDDLAYIFWTAISDDSGTLTIKPFKYIKPSYQNDILIVRTLNISWIVGGDPEIDNQHIHLISPVHKNEYRKDLSSLVKGLATPALECNKVCNVFFFNPKPDKEPDRVFIISGKDEIPLRFEENAPSNDISERTTKIIFQFTEKFLKSVFDEMPSA